MQDIILLAIFAVVMLCVGIGLGRWSVKRSYSYRNDKEAAQYWRDRIDWKDGWSQGTGGYRYVTLDGGQHWWKIDKEAFATKSQKAWDSANRPIAPIIILGPAPAEHLAHLDGMDRLTDHVLKNGPLKFSDPKERKASIGLLEGAGFTVVEKAGVDQ